MNSKQSWEIFDCHLPLVDRGTDFPSTAVPNEATLREHLYFLSRRTPGVGFIVDPYDNALRFGLGGPFGFVECRIPSSPHYKHVAQAEAKQVDTPIEFLSEGLGDPFWPPNLLLRDTVIEIILCFYRTGSPPDWVRWAPKVWEE